jgi:hypothetical protein
MMNLGKDDGKFAPKMSVFTYRVSRGEEQTQLPQYLEDKYENYMDFVVDMNELDDVLREYIEYKFTDENRFNLDIKDFLKYAKVRIKDFIIDENKIIHDFMIT